MDLWPACRRQERTKVNWTGRILWGLILLLLRPFPLVWSVIFNNEHVGIKGKLEGRHHWGIDRLFEGSLGFSYS